MNGELVPHLKARDCFIAATAQTGAPLLAMTITYSGDIDRLLRRVHV